MVKKDPRDRLGIDHQLVRIPLDGLALEQNRILFFGRNDSVVLLPFGFNGCVNDFLRRSSARRSCWLVEFLSWCLSLAILSVNVAIAAAYESAGMTGLAYPEALSPDMGIPKKPYAIPVGHGATLGTALCLFSKVL